MHNVVSLILGGGRGKRLYPLTKQRSEPAVPLAGKYRLIDIPLSNCINSGVNRVYVVTQFLSVSLHRHISDTYKFDPFSRGFVEVLAAQQTNEAADWYRGTADAIRQNIRYIYEDGASDILLLSGDQIYRMDFRRLIQTHRERHADVTVAVTPIPRGRAPDLGLLRLDGADRVIGMVEKPQTEEQIRPFQTPAEWLERRGVAGQGRLHLANMGIYVFSRGALIGLLNAYPTATDLVLQILLSSLATHRIQAYLFDGYWEDLGSIESYHQAHLALASDEPPFDFHSPEGIIYTRKRYLPASRIQAAHVEQCLISDGGIVRSGARLERCVLGVRSQIGRNVTLRETVMIGADRYETEAECAENRKRGLPNYGVGEGSVIQRAILDKDCRIGRNVQIVNRHNLPSAEGDCYAIRDGIVIIPNEAVVPDGTVI
jgi:glucose-1-phosphate adenylyltransferase